MIVDSKNIEFGYELISCVPYAYYLHKKGKLKGTVSGNDTESLYFFSPNHKINPEQRKFENVQYCKAPNTWIHKPFLNKEEFAVPDYRKQFANDEFKFEKETIVICNRYNIEWNYKHINFFSLDTLRELFELLQDKYQIVYINVEGRPELYDNAPPEPLGDFELLKEYPKVINIHDLITDSFNETQLKIFANCQKFITMNGGQSILAAYFGGENILMSKYGKIQTRELNKGINSFYTFYHEFSGQRVVHVKDETDLIKRIKLQWIKKEPIVNILVRTSNRPLFFEECMDSIYKQTHKNINVFVSLDSRMDKYTVDHKVYPVRVKRKEVKPVNKGHTYGVPFPANLYYNDLLKCVKSGIVMYLDDDDILNEPTALRQIVNEYKKGNELIFWRMNMGGRIVPNDINFHKGVPVCRDISGIALAYDSKYKVRWTGYKRGDYRIANTLYKKIDKISYINKVLTAMQTDTAGSGMRLDKKEDIMEKKVKIYFTKAKKGSKYKNGQTVKMAVYMARQYVITGQAIFEEDKKKLKNTDLPEVKKVIKKKRGRPAKKKTA